jgi:peptidoglycan-N-acetylglucosamine deacetylase
VIRSYTAPVTSIALTFDDGPGPSTTEVLDILRDFTAKATFFVLGRNVEEPPWCGGDAPRARALVVRMLSEGHVVGNHTYSHARPDRYRLLGEDVRHADAAIAARRREAGLPEATPPFRLPYGIRLVEQTIPTPTGTINSVALDPRLPVLASLGRTHVHWTSDFDDWTMASADGELLASRMIAHVAAMAEAGLDAVLDLHDSGTGSSWGYDRPATAAGIRLLLEEAGRRGWTTVTVPR